MPIPASFLPADGKALPDRSEEMVVPARHFVLATPLKPPFPPQTQELVVGMGCFWGAERLFWQQPGVYTTAVGYAGGVTANPVYYDVCSGRTGHTEVVRIVFDPQQLPLEAILALFWQSHDPTQGMRQGNDVGTQYRSALYVADESVLAVAGQSARRYQQALEAAGWSRKITTEIRLFPPFYYAEEDHQQYLAKHPDGYCGLRGTGVNCPPAETP